MNQMNDEKNKKSPLKIMCNVLFVIVIIFVVLRIIAWAFILIAFRPLYKNNFSESEKLTIATELDVPAEKISVEKMEFSHGQESCFNIYITTSSLEILHSYEYNGKDYDDKPRYLKKDNNDIHNNIYCTVNSEKPYELRFTLLTWKENLYDMIKVN